MSISITKQPLQYNLSVGKNIWTLSGATQSNQLYLTGVLVNGLTASVLEMPKNPAGVSHFDLSRILKSKLAPENIETIDTFANATSMILDYRLNYGSKIGLTQSFTTLSNVKYVLNGWKPDNIIDWDYSEHIPFSVIYNTCENTNDLIRFNRKYQQLSNYPAINYEPKYKIFNNEYQTQTIFNVIQQSDQVIQNDTLNIAPSFVKYEFFDENNTLLKSYIYPINLTNGAGPWDTECNLGTQSTLERILHIPTGTQNLKDAGIYPTGITASLVSNYKVGVWTRDTCISCPAPTTTTTTTTTSTTTAPPEDYLLMAAVDGDFYDQEDLINPLGYRLAFFNADGEFQQDTYDLLGITSSNSISLGAPFDIKVVEDDKIIMIGAFTNWIGNSVGKIVKLNSNFTLNDEFMANVSTGIGGGFGNSPWRINIQNNKYLITGNFTSFKGETRNRIIRLNTDGTEDTDFYNNLGSGFNGEVSYNRPCLIKDDFSTILVGSFTSFNGETRNRIVKLNYDGTEDTDFYNSLGSAFNSAVYCIRKLTNGDYIIGGAFSSFNGTSLNRLLYLNQDLTINTSFQTNIGSAFNGSVYDFIELENDKLVIVGGFTTFNGESRINIVMLNIDGTEVDSFYTNFSSVVSNFGNIDNVESDLYGNVFIQTYGGSGYDARKLIKVNADGTLNNTFNDNIIKSTNGVARIEIKI